MAETPETPSQWWVVNLMVEVRDPAALWRAAVESLGQSRIGSEDRSHLGPAEAPDVGACLRQILDPGVSPSGTKLIDSEAEECEAP